MAVESRHTQQATFDEVVLPHLAAATRLARWLMRNDEDAEDVVQDASLRALRYFATFSGGSGRAWFLRIVRNTCYSRHSHAMAAADPFDEEQHSALDDTGSPETRLVRSDRQTFLAQALSELPARSRALLVHREIEGLTYQELAVSMGVPIGTVMSRLSRARRALRDALESRSESTPNTRRHFTQPTTKEHPDAAVHGRARSH